MFSNWFWTRLTVGVVRRTNVVQHHRTASGADVIRAIPIENRYPGLAGVPLQIAESTPESERTSKGQHRMLQVVLGLKERIGLSASYSEPYLAEGAPYPQEYLALYPAPQLPEDFAPGKDPVAGVALRGPFSMVTRREGDHFVLDLTHLEGLTPRAPYVKTGGKAILSRVGAGALRTDSVELDGRRYHPGDDGFAQASKRLLVGLNTHMTLIEHLLNCHMITASSFVLGTYEVLPATHPLRALLQPFVIETIRVNNDNIDGLIKSEASNVPSYTGYPLATINQVIKQVAQSFDLRTMDPELRARTQGTLDQPGFLTVQSRVELFRIFREMTQRYCREVLVKVDDDTRKWCQQVDAHFPNGVKALIGLSDWSALTLDQVAHLVATCAFSSSVSHHVVADTVRDYMMQFHIMPPAVDADGVPRRGMVLEKMNSISVASVLRYKLLDEQVPLPGPAAEAVWHDFQAALLAYHHALPSDPEQRRYQIDPARVPSSIHA